MKRTPLRRAGRLRPVSRKRRREARRREAVREAVFARDGHCILSPFGGAWGQLNPNGQNWGPCFGDPLTPHHLQKASHVGEYSEANLVTTCAGHNSMIEDFPIPARDAGLVK